MYVLYVVWGGLLVQGDLDVCFVCCVGWLYWYKVILDVCFVCCVGWFIGTR